MMVRLASERENKKHASSPPASSSIGDIPREIKLGRYDKVGGDREFFALCGVTTIYCSIKILKIYRYPSVITAKHKYYGMDPPQISSIERETVVVSILHTFSRQNAGTKVMNEFLSMRKLDFCLFFLDLRAVIILI